MKFKKTPLGKSIYDTLIDLDEIEPENCYDTEGDECDHWDDMTLYEINEALIKSYFGLEDE